MNEQSKAMTRRRLDSRFENRWLVGHGVDIGCGPDPMKKEDWSKIETVEGYDQVLGHVDAQFVPELQNDSFDFVHSSHCLEHMRDVRSALVNWLRILKPGGFLVCTVPDEVLYESGSWPSQFNPDHKASFSMRSLPTIPSSTSLLNLLWKLPVDVEHVTILTQNWDPSRLGMDQTMMDAECAIEFVVRKPGKKPW